MIELNGDQLHFSFPEVHKSAAMNLSFMRTLRIPDDGGVYSLPPGLGTFPLRHVDDFAAKVPEAWAKRGGVMMPMFQSEAMWLSFRALSGYPFLVKIATGKINAVSGEGWVDTPNRDPQDYVVVPEQPWLDGYCVDKGEIRQFVAMPLGMGYTAEEQVTGEAEFGGLQVVVYPMKAEAWEKRLSEETNKVYCFRSSEIGVCSSMPDMGLAPGGRMKQEIYDDPYDMDVWDLRNGSRCFVNIANSISWRAMTGVAPPMMPPTAEQYSNCGLPWFEYYGEGAEAVDGSATLKGMKSVFEMSGENSEVVLPENESVEGAKVGRVVREGI